MKQRRTYTREFKLKVLRECENGKGKAHTVEFIRNANHDMKLLSCADKLANIRDIINDHERQGESFWNKFNATRDDQAWCYNSMIESIAFGDELITDMPAFKEFKKCVEVIFGKLDP